MITKRLVEAGLAVGESLPIIKDVFHLTRVANPGAAFGLLPDGTLFLAAVTAVVVVVILWMGPRLAGDSRLLRLALGLELGGAVGNLVDRLRAGLVTDFLDFRVWPVFNVADSAIVVGALLLLWGYVTPVQRG
jgi:signal peptidase II